MSKANLDLKKYFKKYKCSDFYVLLLTQPKL